MSPAILLVHKCFAILQAPHPAKRGLNIFRFRKTKGKLECCCAILGLNAVAKSPSSPSGCIHSEPRRNQVETCHEARTVDCHDSNTSTPMVTAIFLTIDPSVTGQIKPMMHAKFDLILLKRYLCEANSASSSSLWASVQ